MKTKAKTRSAGKRKPARKAKPKTAARAVRKVAAIPPGYASITPYLIVQGGAAAVEFYKKAFGARQKVRIDLPDGRIGHAELRIGDSLIMLADEAPQHNAHSPASIGGTPVGIHLYVPNVDAVVERAVAAGATLERPVKDQFYGDRSGSLKDPYGHRWHVATHKEDVAAKEIRRRADAMMKEEAKG